MKVINVEFVNDMIRVDWEEKGERLFKVFMSHDDFLKHIKEVNEIN